MSDPYGLCPRCGGKFHLRQFRREWTGQRVCHGAGTNGCWDPKHPQMNVRGRADRIAVRNPAPEPAYTFVEPAAQTPDTL